MARHGMSRVLSRSCRGIQTWLSPTSLQYPLWHFLWCEWGRIHSHPTQVVYCFCLRRLTQRPRLRATLASLCRRPVLAGDSCHASGKTLGRQLIGHFFRDCCWRIFCIFYFVFFFCFFFFFSLNFSLSCFRFFFSLYFFFFFYTRTYVRNFFFFFFSIVFGWRLRERDKSLGGERGVGRQGRPEGYRLIRKNETKEIEKSEGPSVVSRRSVSFSFVNRFFTPSFFTRFREVIFPRVSQSVINLKTFLSLSDKF